MSDTVKAEARFRVKTKMVQADAVPPYLFGATASAGTKKSYSALQRAPVQKNLIRRYSERRYKKFFLPVPGKCRNARNQQVSVYLYRFRPLA